MALGPSSDCCPCQLQRGMGEGQGHRTASFSAVPQRARLATMDIKDEWTSALRQWAGRNENVFELWLFGSWVKGGSTPESDVDIALMLMPPVDKHNWALGNYAVFRSEWKKQLEAIVGRKVDLRLIGPDFDLDQEVRSTGVRLYLADTLRG
jgi:predicted nucleotidyltransferase